MSSGHKPTTSHLAPTIQKLWTKTVHQCQSSASYRALVRGDLVHGQAPLDNIQRTGDLILVSGHPTLSINTGHPTLPGQPVVSDGEQGPFCSHALCLHHLTDWGCKTFPLGMHPQSVLVSSIQIIAVLQNSAAATMQCNGRQYNIEGRRFPSSRNRLSATWHFFI